MQQGLRESSRDEAEHVELAGAECLELCRSGVWGWAARELLGQPPGDGRCQQQQVQRLEELRGRSVALLGFAAVVVGLIGLRTTTTHRNVYGASVVGALVAFAVVALLTARINRPVKDWDDGENLDGWLDRIKRQDVTVRDFEFSLAHSLNEARRANAGAVGDRAPGCLSPGRSWWRVDVID